MTSRSVRYTLGYMAPHLIVFILVGGLVSGAIAANLTYGMYRSYGFRYMLAYFWAIMIFNAILVIGIASMYFEKNIKADSSPGIALAVDVTYNVLSPLLHIIMVYLLAVAILGLVSRKLGAWVTYLGTILIVLLLGWQGYATYVALDRSSNWIPSLPADITYMIVTLAMFAIFICLYRWADQQPNARKRRNLKTFAALLTALLSLAVLFAAVSFTGFVSKSAVLLIGSLLLVIYILVPVLYLRSFMRAFYGEDRRIATNGTPSEDPSSRFGLTNREIEIVRLVCHGRTNHEIAELLFISHQTVKDHIYHVFQKTGVMNRVQLVNLFSYPPAERDVQP